MKGHFTVYSLPVVIRTRVSDKVEVTVYVC